MMLSFELLQDFIGEQTNPYTHEVYQVLPQHMEQLRSLFIDAISGPRMGLSLCPSPYPGQHSVNLGLASVHRDVSVRGDRF